VTADASPRPLRSDAARNRERVIAAAVEIFAERGLEATMPEVAARAGVGKATVYRSFPTREQLVASIVIERLAWYREQAEAAADLPDAWAAFTTLMFAAAEKQSRDRALAACLAATNDHPDVVQARHESSDAIAVIMRRAQAQGAMRSDATPEDVRLLFGGIGRVLNEDEAADPARWRRATAFVLDAFRADGTPAVAQR
jgi:AcrR family transcriptional regulator